MITPARIRRRAAAAGVSAVDYVIVNERSAVKKFNDGGEANCAGTIFASISIGEQEQRGTQALAASTEKIAGDFADRLVGRGALARQFLFDEDQIVAHQIENFFNRQKRDGTSPPGLALRPASSR
jgi:hypothetical protein